MNCLFCQGPTTLLEEPEINPDPRYLHHFESRTCLKCQTADCSLEFNFMVHHNDEGPELINYWLKYKGYTAVIGVNHPGTEITHDWHTSQIGTTLSTTMCHPILMTEKYSVSLTPENFPRRLKTILVFQ